MEVIGCIFYMAFILEHFMMPVYRDFGLPNYHDKPLHKMVVVGVFGSVIPGTFFLVLGFYCLLHSWMNACAELMHFADRMFYKVRMIVTNRRCCCYHIHCFRDSRQI
jgi:sterol O-acyltransferase